MFYDNVFPFTQLVAVLAIIISNIFNEYELTFLMYGLSFLLIILFVFIFFNRKKIDFKPKYPYLFIPLYIIAFLSFSLTY